MGIKTVFPCSVMGPQCQGTNKLIFYLPRFPLYYIGAYKGLFSKFWKSKTMKKQWMVSLKFYKLMNFEIYEAINGFMENICEFHLLIKIYLSKTKHGFQK